MTDPSDLSIWRDLEQASDDELLERLADEVTLGVGPSDGPSKRKLASDYLTERYARLRTAVCSPREVQELIAAELPEDLVLAAAIYDFVLSVTGQTPAATVSMLLVRRGLTLLCRNLPT